MLLLLKNLVASFLPFSLKIELAHELTNKAKESLIEDIPDSFKFELEYRDGKRDGLFTIDEVTEKIYKDGKVIADPVVKDGKAAADGLCEGKYTIVIKAEGYEDIEYTIELDCDKAVESEKEMTEKKKEEADSCCEGSLQLLLKVHLAIMATA